MVVNAGSIVGCMEGADAGRGHPARPAGLRAAWAGGKPVLRGASWTAPDRKLQPQPLGGATLWHDLVHLLRERRQRRRLLRGLARHHGHLLLDMGFDPDEVRAAMELSAWDAWRPELVWRGPRV